MSDVLTLHEGKWLGLYQRGHWEFARRPNADACVGVLAVTDDDEVILIEQYRVPLGQNVIEICAGLVGDEEDHRGEALAETAGRELLEETGFRASNIRELIATPTSAGMTSEFTHLFLATGLTRVHEGGGVGHEKIKTHIVPRKELRTWLREREAEGLAIDFKIHAALWLAEL